MRRTRAAQRAAAEATQSSDTSDAHTLQPELIERVPLGDVTANAHNIADPEPTEIADMPPKRSKSRAGAKKGAKGKKAKATATATEEQTETIRVQEDDRQAAGSPASDAAVEDLAIAPASGTCLRILYSPA